MLIILIIVGLCGFCFCIGSILSLMARIERLEAASETKVEAAEIRPHQYTTSSRPITFEEYNALQP